MSVDTREIRPLNVTDFIEAFKVVCFYPVHCFTRSVLHLSVVTRFSPISSGMSRIGGKGVVMSRHYGAKGDKPSSGEEVDVSSMLEGQSKCKSY